MPLEYGQGEEEDEVEDDEKDEEEEEEVVERADVRKGHIFSMLSLNLSAKLRGSKEPDQIILFVSHCTRQVPCVDLPLQ